MQFRMQGAHITCVPTTILGTLILYAFTQICTKTSRGKNCPNLRGRCMSHVLGSPGKERTPARTKNTPEQLGFYEIAIPLIAKPCGLRGCVFCTCAKTVKTATSEPYIALDNIQSTFTRRYSGRWGNKGKETSRWLTSNLPSGEPIITRIAASGWWNRRQSVAGA